ncbi:MAG TPA: c-type cytochrome [Acidimicrobiales bacterium]|nr:c-type cytochrome [Acidimicrobiales bacterium]
MRRVLPPVVLVAFVVALGLVLFAPAPRQARPLGRVTLADATSQNQAASVAEGRTLFEQSCSSCHGSEAQGSALAPNLRGLGAATVDLWVSSGWMPLANPTAQPIKKPPVFDRQQTLAIADFVESLGGGPRVPSVNLRNANVSAGFSVFALNCAPCHTITGAGDALSNGISAPSLHDVTATQVAEAVRTGPANMPRFSPDQISNAQLADLIAYVTRGIQHPAAPGGLSLGGVGPVAEGFVGLFVGVGVCLLFALWIGDRSEREEAGAGTHEEGAHA